MRLPLDYRIKRADYEIDYFEEIERALLHHLRHGAAIEFSDEGVRFGDKILTLHGKILDPEDVLDAMLVLYNSSHREIQIAEVCGTEGGEKIYFLNGSLDSKVHGEELRCIRFSRRNMPVINSNF